MGELEKLAVWMPSDVGGDAAKVKKCDRCRRNFSDRYEVRRPEGSEKP